MAWVTSLMIDAMLLAAVAGFYRAFDTTGNPIMHSLLRGFCWLVVAWLLRSAYWDVLQYSVGRETWVMVRDTLGGQNISVVFNLIAMRGMYWILRAKLEMIPEEKRGRYRWWNAWLYPPSSTCFSVIRHKREKENGS